MVLYCPHLILVIHEILLRDRGHSRAVSDDVTGVGCPHVPVYIHSHRVLKRGMYAHAHANACFHGPHRDVCSSMPLTGSFICCVTCSGTPTVSRAVLLKVFGVGALVRNAPRASCCLKNSR